MNDLAESEGPTVSFYRHGTFEDLCRGGHVDSTKDLGAFKLLHTAAWVFFVASIIGVWVSAWDARFTWFLVCVGIVMVEVLILLFNGMQCPLTPIAARYTTDRRPNFDIYLPEWLAKHNKTIFGSLFVLGMLYGVVRFANLP